MNILTKTTMAVLAVFAVSGISQAEVLTAAVQANIQQPVSLNEITPLDFATILANNAADDIVMNNDPLAPTITSTTGNSILTGTFTQGVVRISGTPNSSTSVQADATTTITNTSGDTMQVVTIAVNRAQPALDGQGVTDVTVGGKLVVGVAQAPGLYTGTYNVTVNYL